ncbi:MAG: aldo/keto reductase [Chloroflexi bacterium]|nr:MAG: aldo/keto reductase [Chloroflexota bacterium]
MERRRFGVTGLQISPVGFGGWAIGGDRNATGSLGPSDDREAVAAIGHALELGVNWIDTAPGYGAGHSEELVGKAIHGLAEKPYIFTKCGFVWDSRFAMVNVINAVSIRSEVEQSLRRLRIEAIDLYQIHWVEPENDSQIEEAWAALADLKNAGKVLHIGVSNFDVAQLHRAGAITRVESLQPPYSFVERSIEAEILPHCARNDIGVVVYSPMQSGLLSGAMTRHRVERMPPDDARLSDPNFVGTRLADNLRKVERLRGVAEKWGWTPSEVAVAWTLRRNDVHGAIVGFRRPSQVDGVLGKGNLVLDHEQIDAVEAIGW